MELRCDWCGETLLINSIGTYYPCGHRLCRRCHSGWDQPPTCVACPVSSWTPAAKGGTPETLTVKPQPRPPLHPAPPPSASPHPTPSWNTTRSTSLNHGAPQKGSHQSSLQQTGDPRRTNDSQKSEADPRPSQGSMQTLWQQEPSNRSKVPLKSDAVTGAHSSAQLDSEQKTPHTRKAKHRSPLPYPLKSPKDEYLDPPTFNCRETLTPPSRSRNASPSPFSTSDTSRVSSSSQLPAHCALSSSRTRDTEMVTDSSRRKEREEEEEEELVMTLGLPNLGNSCYINGVVQCLYHLPPLRNALALYTDLQHHQTHPYSEDETGVAQALGQLFKFMPTDNEMTRLSTQELKQVLGSHDEAFGGRQQQEAHDLFSAIVTWLHTDLSQYEVLDTPYGLSLFDGRLEMKLVCRVKGKTLTDTKEPFTSISLAVVGLDRWSMEDLLDKHFREQTLEWDCDHCSRPHPCAHLTRIVTCPTVLVIHFSRIPDSRNRRKTKVEFPASGFSLQKYMVSESTRSPTYQLLGAVCHHGSMSGGHYTAYCRYGRGPRGRRWRLCNDSLVRDVDEGEVLGDEDAHLLFYVQQ